jgi:C1A family cysteine protease
MLKIQRYGWKRGLPDQRDMYYTPKMSLVQAAPPVIDLRPTCPPVYDQGDLGSCTANAIGGLAQFLMKKEGHKDFTPSRLFIYWNERAIEGSIMEDSGAIIRDGMKVVNQLGCPHESLWWYDTAKFRIKPNKKVYADGVSHTMRQYVKVDNTNLWAMKSVLAEGHPIVGGFTVYESFESQSVAQTGKVPMPGRSENILGGHAIMVVGYDDTKQVYIVRNSWGTRWGDKGYFYMPYSYFSNPNLADDFWTGSLVVA